MDISDNIFLAIIDKLLIGVVVLIAGYWLNSKLEKLKGQIALQNAVAAARGEAYQKLWKLTEKLSPRGESLPSKSECEGAFLDLREWYYSDGNAMYLSLKATDFFLKCLEALEKANQETAKRNATALRTQMKIDIGTYTERESRVQLPIPG